MIHIKLLMIRFKSILYALFQYIHDYIFHIKYSVSYHGQRSQSKDMTRCQIMLLNHQLEKAQTYSNPKLGYGKDKVCSLLNKVSAYFDKYGIDELVIMSVGVLDSHFNNEYSYKSDRLITQYTELKSRIGSIDVVSGGIIQINQNNHLRLNDLLEFMQSRHSARVYSDEDISPDEIDKAIEYAQSAPSACNRQCVRAHYYSDKEIIKDIIYAQESDINWCLGAQGLFIITANKSYFRDFHERNQSMFDAGLFSMNLVLGLHNMGIGSCFKMAQKTYGIDQRTKTIAKIPDNEDISVLLLVGKYLDSKVVIAKSSRLPVDTVCIKHDRNI